MSASMKNSILEKFVRGFNALGIFLYHQNRFIPVSVHENFKNEWNQSLLGIEPDEFGELTREIVINDKTVEIGIFAEPVEGRDDVKLCLIYEKRYQTSVITNWNRIRNMALKQIRFDELLKTKTKADEILEMANRILITYRRVRQIIS